MASAVTIGAKGPYLYFAEAEVATTTEAIMVPANSYLGANPKSDTTIDLSFADVVGTDTVTVVTLTIADDTHKQVMEALASIMNSNPNKANNGIIVVADAEDTTAKELTTATGGAGTSYSPAVFGTKTAVYHKEFNGNVTGVAIA
tara:strand:+ start:622 stop:1056 length:435 start_codon:yes stop_codon:yes gene_type:complete